MTFSIFFQQLTYATNACQSIFRTSDFFRGTLQNSQETPMLQSQFNKVITEKIFYQQNIIEPSEKREKIETACKKNNRIGKTKT